ncbi:MAG: hypothetical protein NTV46_06820 [Verrucomicrobia bacterium]|nr:hypothetical protein [Verrucomicrobiota bacterium]
MKKPSVILDKSFLQAERRDCFRLHLLANAGCRLVLIDTAVYELATDSKDEERWQKMQRKLADLADSIEVWYHVSDLLNHEIARQNAIDSPVDEDGTLRLRELLKTGKPWVPSDFGPITRKAKRQRERDSVIALIGYFRKWMKKAPDLCAEVRKRFSAGNKLDGLLKGIVNSDDWIKMVLRDFHGKRNNREFYIEGAKEGLDDRWFARHHARSVLARWCICLPRFGPKDVPGPNFCNTKLDCDYLIALHFADFLATNETRGDMATMCAWLYGSSKGVFSVQRFDTLLPQESEIPRYSSIRCGSVGSAIVRSAGRIFGPSCGFRPDGTRMSAIQT